MPKRTYEVIDGPLSVRREPNGQWLKQYNTGYQFVADSDTKTEVGGYVWVKHDEGWSAHSTLNKSKTYLKRVEKESKSDTAAKEPEPKNTESESQTLYFKANQDVRVRHLPSTKTGNHLYWLNEGDMISTQSNTRTEANGYIWWQHKDGWSASESTNGNIVLMNETSAPTEVPTTQSPPTSTQTKSTEESSTPTTSTIYLKANQGVRIRHLPSTKTGKELGWLEVGDVIETRSNTRTEANGYIWWQHKDGWSASQSVDGKWVYMNETSAPVEAPATPQTTDEPSDTTTSAPSVPQPTVVKLQAKINVRARAEADLNGREIKWVLAGTVIECNMSSQKVNDGYIWLHHKDGWSAWKNTSGTEVYLVEPGSVEDVAVITDDGLDVSTLPELKTLVKRLPVALNQTHWWQYFGNNVYAYENGRKWGYHTYAQGLHSGLDFGNNNAGIPVYAGVDCAFVKNDKYGIFTKSGSYTFIYQHLTNTTSFSAGQPISVDTKLGELDPTVGLRHLHFEIRYKEIWIVNPLLLMPDEMVSSITDKFVPGPRYFYKSGAWNKWQTPMDQPVIELAGPLIGPTAG